MATDAKLEAASALHRFGFGPRIGSIAAIASDPRGALLAELERPGAGRISDPDLPTSGDALRRAFRFRQAQEAARRAQRAERAPIAGANQNPNANSSIRVVIPPQAKAPAEAGSMENGATESNAGASAGNMEARPGQAPAAENQAAARNQTPPLPQQIYLQEAKARIDAALGTDIGFVERLVWFWSNHFCVSADKGPVRPICGAFEREAIRAHVLGKFSDMLIAVESHPAMLLYLDNARSIGPNSIAGIFRGRGLNENLAREILELHTLGVRTVYTQDDVTRFANVITGWSIVPPRLDPVRGGEFDFNARMHEPGAQKVINKTYAESGYEQGRAVLLDLARHPATANHVCEKFARHFVADQPPPALVERLTRRFRESDGNLKELAKALINSPEAWSAPRSKLKRPGEWIVSALRATGVTPPDVRPVMQAHNVLGEPLWRPPAPKGFSDHNADWADGLAQRLDIANQLARRVGALVDPQAVADAALGPLASRDTMQAVTRAESRPQALALLLMAPEFQRR
jgi:uncharacterized protein (DUF1800 family)